MEKRKYVELLTPAGSPAAFYAAVNAGADAVYLGGPKFGARAYAENFTTEELVACIRYGRLVGCRVYLTVNTLMKENELSELNDYLRPFYEAGLDGVIVQDFGAFRQIKEIFPGLELHASTQMTLCSSYGAELLKSMGASRIVPARELSLAELINIRQSVDIELETFIHGAMCYCYSGQCLFSSILGGRSGNRGRCAQPCRLPYSVKLDGRRGREQYPLSLKDMCTIEHLPEFIEAGIDSFKIEGRMKRPEYAAGVTSVYRRYIDRYYQLRGNHGAEEAAERFRVEKTDRRILNSLYIRSEVQDGYYFKHNGKEMVTLDSPAYSATDDALLQRLHEQFLGDKKKLPVILKGYFRIGNPARLEISSGSCSVCVTGQTVDHALKQPVTEENVRKQLGKLGDSCFCAEDIYVELDSDAFYPLKQINDLRRLAVSELEEKMLAGAGDRKQPSASIIPDTTEVLFSEKTQTGFAVSVTNHEQLTALEDWMNRNPENTDVTTVYANGNLIAQDKGGNSEICGRLSGRSRIFLTLPHVLRNADKPYLDRLYALCGERESSFSGYLLRSADGLGYLMGQEKNGEWHFDASFYTWNKQALLQLGAGAESFCLPYELNKAEQQRLMACGAPFEKVVYGRIPMMVTANCVLRTTDQCRKNSETETVLCDRYHKEFPVIRDCMHCMNIIYNSVPLVLLRDLPRWKDRARLRLDFTVESPEEMCNVLDTFLLGTQTELGEYTTGHEKRGVE